MTIENCIRKHSKKADELQKEIDTFSAGLADWITYANSDVSIDPLINWYRNKIAEAEAALEEQQQVIQWLSQAKIAERNKQTLKTEMDYAIEDLKREYKKAKSLQFVMNPMAYALYQTWKKWDDNSYRKGDRRD